MTASLPVPNVILEDTGTQRRAFVLRAAKGNTKMLEGKAHVSHVRKIPTVISKDQLRSANASRALKIARRVQLFLATRVLPVCVKKEIIFKATMTQRSVQHVQLVQFVQLMVPT